MARASCGCGSRMECRDMRVSAAAAGRQHGSRLKQRKRLLRTLAACSFAVMMAESTQCPAHRAARWTASTAAVHGRQLRGGSKRRHEWTSGSMNTRSMRRGIVGLHTCSRAVGGTGKKEGQGARCCGCLKAAGWKQKVGNAIQMLPKRGKRSEQEQEHKQAQAQVQAQAQAQALYSARCSAHLRQHKEQCSACGKS